MLALRSFFVASIGMVAIWVAGFLFAPGQTQVLFERLSHNVEVALAPDCNADPVACLIQKKDDLIGVSERLDRERASLEVESPRAADLVAENRELLAQNTLYLTRGREILSAAKTGARLNFIGTEYPSGEALREQLQLLFSEGKRLKEGLERSETLDRRLKEARRNIIAQRSEVLAALASIPRKIALAKAEEAYATLESDLASLENILRRGRTRGDEADSLMRSTATLHLDAIRSNRIERDFAQWLSASNQ